MSSQEPPPTPLRDVAQNPVATARYLAEVQRTLNTIKGNLEMLAFETSLLLRGTHLEGDRSYHAALRARPVEKELSKVLKQTEKLAKGLEKSAYARHAHDEAVVNTLRGRKEKEREKARRRSGPQSLQQAPGGRQAAQSTESGYREPTSIYDLGKRESA